MWRSRLTMWLPGLLSLTISTSIRTIFLRYHLLDPILFPFHFEHTYSDSLPGCYIECSPARVRQPKLLKFNSSLAEELGLDGSPLTAELAAQIFSGNQLPTDARPIAQAYAGHQFGNFVPQLGDGRALLIGECLDGRGERRDLVLKGSGRTPFSRGGDGKAAVGPVLREYLMGEAMHALGIPTTRALAAVATGEPVLRERPLPGAVLTRVAKSHIRVGTFQFFAARGEMDQVRRLAEYVVQRHYPELIGTPDRYLSMLRETAHRQARLVAQWMLVGFIHGVMNTDNMAISGETIDYGPCALMEAYDPTAVFSSIDVGGRYAYGNQPVIALWNLTRFAETLVLLIDEANTERAVEQATEILETFYPTFQRHFYHGACTKLGYRNGADVEQTPLDQDRQLVDDWLNVLGESSVDFTLGWRRLADAAEGNDERLTSVFEDLDTIKPWLHRWRSRLGASPMVEVAAKIREVNPIYIPRNHLVEEAITAAWQHGNMGLFDELLEAVQRPFVEQSQWSRYAEPASPNFTACYQTFCGT